MVNYYNLILSGTNVNYIGLARRVNADINIVGFISSLGTVQVSDQYQLFAYTGNYAVAAVTKPAVVTPGYSYRIASDLSISQDTSIQSTSNVITVVNSSAQDVYLRLQNKIIPPGGTAASWFTIWNSPQQVKADATFTIAPTGILAAWSTPDNVLADIPIPGKLENFILVDYTGLDTATKQEIRFTGDGTLGPFDEPRGLWTVIPTKTTTATDDKTQKEIKKVKAIFRGSDDVQIA